MHELAVYWHLYFPTVIKILIPTYNEAGNIEGIIVRIQEVLPEAEIVVIDDSSPDGTGKVVSAIAEKNKNVRLLSRDRKEGLGKAYLYAFENILKEPSVEAIVMMDADFSHDPAHLKEFIEKSKEYDVVIGSRYVPGGKTVGWEPWRTALSKYGNAYAKAITGAPVRDLTGGFNLISINALRKVSSSDLDSSGYAFQIELKYLLFKAGARIIEVPILFSNRKEGESKISNHIIGEGLLAPWRLKLKHR